MATQVTPKLPEATPVVARKKRGRPRTETPAPQAQQPSQTPEASQAPAPLQRLSERVEQVLIGGDLAGLSPDERMSYYHKVCETTGLNPYTQPFEYLVLNGKLVLYARKNCTDQLRRIHGVSVDKATPTHDLQFGIYTVVVEGHDREGRHDTGLGVVNVAGLKGDMLANAMMKAETKAKRRFTLSVCGLGMLDESELESIPGVRTNGYTESEPPQLPAPQSAATQPVANGAGGQVVWSARDNEMIKAIAQTIHSCKTFEDFRAANKKCYDGAAEAADPVRVRAELAKFVEAKKKQFPEEVAQFTAAREARRAQRAN